MIAIAEILPDPSTLTLTVHPLPSRLDEVGVAVVLSDGVYAPAVDVMLVASRVAATPCCATALNLMPPVTSRSFLDLTFTTDAPRDLKSTVF